MHLYNRITMSSNVLAVLLILLGLTCGYSTAYIDEQDMKGKRDHIRKFVNQSVIVSLYQ